MALLDLLAEVGTVTATEAANRLGHSSGLCSFHLRQLARYGLIEEAPHSGGRARPWRLRWGSSPRPDQEPPTEFTALTRDLEDESYQRWLSQRERAPREWRGDESFSAVVHLTPAELTALAASVRSLLSRYRERDRQPSARPTDAVPVAAITRIFPLLVESGGPVLPPAADG